MIKNKYKKYNMDCYLRTKYPKIYKKTYWGGFNENINITEEIIENRNKFVENYDIAKCVMKIPRKIQKHFDALGLRLDHQECYLTHDKTYVLIASPYCDDRVVYENQGWHGIEPIYSTAAWTFIKLIP